MNHIDSQLHAEKRKEIEFDAIVILNDKAYEISKDSPVIGEPYAIWSYDGYWMTFASYSGLDTVWPTYKITLKTY